MEQKLELEKAFLLHQQGHLDQAENIYKEILRTDSQNYDVLRLLGTINLQKNNFSDAIELFDQAIKFDKSDASLFGNKGVALQNLKRFEEALENFDIALNLKSDFVEAFYNRGNVFFELQNFEYALENYNSALKIKSDYVDALYNQANTLRNLKRYEEALESYDCVLKIKPNHLGVLNNRSNTLRDLQRYEEALDGYNYVLKIKPDCIEAIYVRCTLSLALGNFSEGWHGYLYRPSLRGNKKESKFNSLISEDGNLLSFNPMGKRITLLKDQGIGDEIFFMRFATELKNRGASWITYFADPRIAPMIQRAKLVDEVIACDKEIIETDKFVFSIGDLPLLTEMKSEADIKPAFRIPVLLEKQTEISNRLACHSSTSYPLVGITWRAGTKSTSHNTLFKEISLTQLAHVFKDKAVTLVIVQRNPEANEILEFETALGRSVINCIDLNDDLEGMLALMDLLDDYVGVSNTNMHLRASVGKTAHVLIPTAEFRWLDKGNTSPWFPGFTIYRANKSDWSVALSELGKEFPSITKNYE